jgi:hypothetical protein
MKVASINSLDEECANSYEEITQVWTQFLENEKIQALEQRLQTTQEKKHNIKDTMNTLLPTNQMSKIIEKNS